MKLRRQKVDRMLLAVLVAGLAAGWALALAAAPPAAATTLDGLTDRTHKMNMLGRLGYNPRLVFFGGSRSFRFEPSYARRRWGLRGFNCAVMENTHEDVWAMVHHLVRRAPKLREYVVWGIQPGGFFTNKQFDVGLVRDSRLRRYFPYDLRQKMDGGMTHTWGHRVYARDGALLWDNYDRQVAAGVTLDASLAAYIERALKQRSDEDSIPTTVSRTRRYFEDTLAYMNQHDIEPLLLIMPIHPRVIRAVRDVHWDNRRASFKAYLVGLQSRYHFTFVDFTFIRTFDGDPDAFYDGVHMKRSNMRRLLRASVRKAPWAFGRAPAPWDVAPTPTPASSGVAARR
jgi:hypothetical protein